MTAQEMVNAFLLEYDLNGSGAVAGFEVDEIESFLNKAQLNIIKKGVIDAGPELFEILIDHHVYNLYKISDDYQFVNSFKALHDPIENNPINPDDFYSVPLDYLFYISSRTMFTRTNFPAVTDAWAENMVIKKENLGKYLPSEANKTIFWNPVVIASSNNFTVIIDSFTSITDFSHGSDYTNVQNDSGTGITNFMLSYIREPLKISITPVPSIKGDCELNERWHQSIVDAAIGIALLITNDARIRNKVAAK